MFEKRKERKRISKKLAEFESFLSGRFSTSEACDVAVDRMRSTLDGTIPIDAHLAALKGRLDNAEVDELIRENQGELVLLYRSLSDAFERNDLIDINKLAAVPKDVHRINQIETIIDLYTMKINRAKADESLSDEDREKKIQAWEHLMEKDIDALGGSV